MRRKKDRLMKLEIVKKILKRLKKLEETKVRLSLLIPRKKDPKRLQKRKRKMNLKSRMIILLTLKMKTSCSKMSTSQMVGMKRKTQSRVNNRHQLKK